MDSNLPTQKLFPSFVLVLFTAFFLLLATKANSKKTVSFNFTKFSKGQTDIILQGSTYIYADGFLALPDVIEGRPNVGRVLYSNPFPIWDRTTGIVADFETSFTFEVLKYEVIVAGDGLVFFLTNSGNAKIPDNSGQGLLGVVDAKNAFNPFVGVEFDNFVNPWDPNYAHVGINVNSLSSVKIMPWRWPYYDRITLVKVKIMYSSLSSTLTVDVTDEDGQTSSISQMLDLKWLLPEMAVVGISGSSGILQEHNIFSWSFKSVLETTTSSNSENINNNITQTY